MPIIKRKPKTKESRKKVTPDYVEKSKTKTKGTKPVTSTPSSNPKPGISSRVSKPEPKKPDGVLITHPSTGTTRPNPGYKKPNPGVTPGKTTPRPRPGTPKPSAGQSGKLGVEKLRQISHNHSMHGKGESGSTKSLGKKARRR